MIEQGQQIERLTLPLDKDCPILPGHVCIALKIVTCECGISFVDVGLWGKGSYCANCKMVLSQTNWLSPVEYWAPYTGAKIVSIRKNILEQSKN